YGSRARQSRPTRITRIRPESRSGEVSSLQHSVRRHDAGQRRLARGGDGRNTRGEVPGEGQRRDRLLLRIAGYLQYGGATLRATRPRSGRSSANSIDLPSRNQRSRASVTLPCVSDPSIPAVTRNRLEAGSRRGSAASTARDAAAVSLPSRR